jgi:hypothetical protein
MVMRALRVAGIATVLGLGSFVFLMVRRERRQAVGRPHVAVDNSRSS